MNRAAAALVTAALAGVAAGVGGFTFVYARGAGQPLEEPVAWYGPIVMNTQEELRHAFEQLDRGTFLRPDAPR